MATAVRVDGISSGEPYAAPAIEFVDDAVRSARRAVKGARTAAEDFVDGASLEVRRHPLTAVGLAASAGLVTGCLLGLSAAWFIRSRG
jgi:ElaB/YqjD/DUF883 family membrane-anchored ribosome-binding protein